MRFVSVGTHGLLKKTISNGTDEGKHGKYLNCRVFELQIPDSGLLCCLSARRFCRPYFLRPAFIAQKTYKPQPRRSHRGELPYRRTSRLIRFRFVRSPPKSAIVTPPAPPPFPSPPGKSLYRYFYRVKYRSKPCTTNARIWNFNTVKYLFLLFPDEFGNLAEMYKTRLLHDEISPLHHKQRKKQKNTAPISTIAISQGRQRINKIVEGWNISGMVNTSHSYRGRKSIER